MERRQTATFSLEAWLNTGDLRKLNTLEVQAWKVLTAGLSAGFTKFQNDLANLLIQEIKARKETRACYVEFIKNSISFITVWIEQTRTIFEDLSILVPFS